MVEEDAVEVVAVSATLIRRRWKGCGVVWVWLVWVMVVGRGACGGVARRSNLWGGQHRYEDVPDAPNGSTDEGGQWKGVRTMQSKCDSEILGKPCKEMCCNSLACSGDKDWR